MTTTPRTIHLSAPVLKLQEAADAGTQWAKNLKPGDEFLGASPAAIAAGYESGTPAYRLFLYFALDVLEKRDVITSAAEPTILISIDPKGAR